LQANFDQGVLAGVKSRWWPSGILREEAYWSEGKYIGRRLWDQTGRLIKEEIMPQN
jgi:antitoxin component YwqK of YwqJK toxin-antitoxin module